MSRGLCGGIAVLIACVTAALTGCRERLECIELNPAAAIAEGELLPAIDLGLERAVGFLGSQQAKDGAWRSDVYAPFRQGDALTPVVLAALGTLPDERQPAEVIAHGLKFLQSLVGPEGQIAPPKGGIAYPVYTAAGALLALGNRTDPESQQAREAWIGYLLARQLTEANGWEPVDAFYGGWGYDAELPRKPPPGVPLGPLTEPNLSATVFALTALRAAGVESTAAEMQQAIAFVRGCQNVDPKIATLEAPAAGDFNDGGFYFVQSDAVRNKAGIRGKDAGGRERFHSYGSATADGLLAYAACGVPATDPRAQAAWRWLAKSFSAERHPGEYAAGRQAERDSVYFYYCHSLAELLQTVDDQALPEGVERRAWARQIAVALLGRQRSDGSWINHEVEVRENDPLVATALATRALAMCRRLIVVESEAARGTLPHDDRPESQDPPAHPGRRAVSLGGGLPCDLRSRGRIATAAEHFGRPEYRAICRRLGPPG
jgi:hypothetical protein